MLALHPEFVVDHKAQKKSVLVSSREWRRLIETLEELEDIRAYDKAKARRETAIPFEKAVRQSKAKTGK